MKFNVLAIFLTLLSFESNCQTKVDLPIDTLTTKHEFEQFGSNRLLGGSTVIILKALDYICIAADTKLVLISDSLKDEGKTCKIKTLNNFIYTNTGIIKDSKGILDVDKIVFEAGNRYEDLNEIYTYSVSQISSKLTELYSDLNDTLRNNYNNILLRNHCTISLALVGIYKNKLTIFASHFTIKDNKCIHTKVEGTDNIGLLTFGSQDEINNYLDKYPNPLKNGLESGMEFLIRLEAEKHPELVSLPVDILLLTNNGIKWLMKNE